MLKSILRDQQDLHSTQKIGVCVCVCHFFYNEVKKDKLGQLPGQLCNIIIIKYDYAAVMTE